MLDPRPVCYPQVNVYVTKKLSQRLLNHLGDGSSYPLGPLWPHEQKQKKTSIASGDVGFKETRKKGICQQADTPRASSWEAGRRAPRSRVYS